MPLISPDFRPKSYAAAELFLDVLYAVRKIADVDLESVAIYVCVGEATMRPVINDAALVEQIANVDVAPEDMRGSITMLLVSDRLGLPRETVRRKVKQLIAGGLLYEDANGRIRTTPNFTDPRMMEAVNSVHDAGGIVMSIRIWCDRIFRLLPVFSRFRAAVFAEVRLRLGRSGRANSALYRTARSRPMAGSLSNRFRNQVSRSAADAALSRRLN